LNECTQLKGKLLELGKIYNDNIEDESYYTDLIMDTDFSNRSVLKIITTCGLEPLLSETDPKAENLINTLYVGKEANMCDGSLSGYSNFLHILNTSPKEADTSLNKLGDFPSMVSMSF